MDLDDERLHRRRVPWATLAKEGVDPQKIMIEAQKRRLYRIENLRRAAEV